MDSPALIKTPNVIREGDVALFFLGLELLPGLPLASALGLDRLPPRVLEPPNLAS